MVSTFGLLFFSVAVVFAPLAARAQSAPDLIAQNAAARGGADKLAAITSVEFTGKVIYPGDFELTYKETRARHNGRARIDSTIQGLTLVQAFDGTTGWRINPFEGRRDAERMSADDTRALADDATIDGPLLSAKARGSTVSYLGREDLEGTSAYKLRIVDASGVQYDDYLDPDTYLEIKVVETRKIRGAPQVTLTEYGDYERVDGVYFPFAVESGAAGTPASQHQQLTIESARANIPVDDALFRIPTAGAK